MEKILNRIQKLLALSRDNANVHEAATAAATAQRLMTAHGIAEAAVRAAEHGNTRDEPIVTVVVDSQRVRDRWRGALILGVCEANGAGAYWRPDAHTAFDLLVVAPESAVAPIRYMYGHLCSEIQRLAKAEKNKTSRFRNAFLLGAASTLHRRLTTAAREQRAQARSEATAEGSTALARIDSGLALLDRTKERVQAAMPTALKHARALKKFDAQGFSAGREAARNIDLEGKQKALRA